MNNSLRNVAISDYDKNFICKWKNAFDDFKITSDNKFYLIGPSSYLFSIDGIKFAVDPQIRRQSDLKKLSKELINDFSNVSFVLITHEHGDHLCPSLINCLKDLDIEWFIPKGARSDYIERTGLAEKKITWINTGDVIKKGNLTIKSFFTPHAVGKQPFLQCGYEIVCSKGKIIIPGDIRDYDYDGYPDFGKVDLCISHLWAGKNSLDENLYLPMLENFVEASCRFSADKYFLCHLFEIGRDEQSLWSFKHAGLAMNMFYELLPESVVEVPYIGKSYDLFKGK